MRGNSVCTVCRRVRVRQCLTLTVARVNAKRGFIHIHNHYTGFRLQSSPLWLTVIMYCLFLSYYQNEVSVDRTPQSPENKQECEAPACRLLRYQFCRKESQAYSLYRPANDKSFEASSTNMSSMYNILDVKSDLLRYYCLHLDGKQDNKRSPPDRTSFASFQSRDTEESCMFSLLKKEDMVSHVVVRRQEIQSIIKLFCFICLSSKNGNDKTLQLLERFECQSSPFFLSLHPPIHSLPSPSSSMRGDGEEVGESKKRREWNAVV